MSAPAAVAVLAGLALFATALPAWAANGVSVTGRRVTVTLPVDVRGPISGADAALALNLLANPLEHDPLYGCFAVRADFVEASSPGGHVVTVLPQRPGQFLRATATGDDPYAASRGATIGSLALRAGAPRPGPVALLLAAGEPAPGRAPVQELQASVLEETGAAAGSPAPCRWTGTVALSAVYERYRLRVTSTVPFSFTVDARGRIKGSVQPATRSAVSEDPDVGHCSGSGLPMFPLGLRGRTAGGAFELTFVARGPERDFELSCDRGTVNIGGDYLRAVFLPLGRVSFTLNARNDATTNAKNSMQGRNASAVVTIRRD